MVSIRQMPCCKHFLEKWSWSFAKMVSWRVGKRSNQTKMILLLVYSTRQRPPLMVGCRCDGWGCDCGAGVGRAGTG